MMRVVGACGALALTVAVCAQAPSDGAGASKPAAAPLSVLALRLGVTDLARSVEFYSAHLGFTLVEDQTPSGYVVLTNEDVTLVLTKCAEPVTIAEDACRVRFNFKTRDLDAAEARFKAAGVPIVGTAESAVGRFFTFTDPSGHRHNLKQLFKDDEVYESPRVYDVGIAVSDMPKAEAFYTGVLGFEVMTRKYYPPVVPYTQRGCTFFILSDGQSKPAPYDYGRVAHAGLALQTDNLEAEIARLKAAGVVFVHDQPQQAVHVRFAAFKDPFGNVHELVQPPAAPAEPAAKASP